MISLILFSFTFINVTQSNAIVGGRLFSEEGYKRSALIGIQSVYGTKMDICTGILLNATTVLTAAHCFDNINFATITMFKSLDMNKDRRQQMRIFAHQIVLHPNYLASNKVSSDFAIVKLNQIFSGSDSLHYPRLLADAKGDHYGLYGYGFDENNQHGVLKLVFKTKAEIVPSNSEEFVSFSQQNGQGICNGDSGGPLIVSFNNINHVVAINDSVSGPSGRECFGKGNFRKIAPVMDWIKSNM